jgi:mannosyltransferase OCH1-like enzyme
VRLIPARLHHIWLGEHEPSEFVGWLRDDFVSRHKHWECFYWRDELELRHPAVAHLREALEKHWREIEKTCDNQRRWAFRADLLRLVVLYIHGGVYVDHDMFNVKPLDPLLDEDLILMQFRENQVGEGIIGAPQGSPKILEAIKWLLDYGVRRLMGLRLGPLSRHNGWKSFEPEYFCPHPRMNPGDIYRCTDKTYTIHCWRDHQYDRERLLALR